MPDNVFSGLAPGLRFSRIEPHENDSRPNARDLLTQGGRVLAFFLKVPQGKRVRFLLAPKNHASLGKKSWVSYATL